MLELISLKKVIILVLKEFTGYGVDFNPGKIQYLPGQISVVRAFPPQFVPQSGYNVIYNVIVRVMITFSEAIW